MNSVPGSLMFMLGYLNAHIAILPALVPTLYQEWDPISKYSCWHLKQTVRDISFKYIIFHTALYKHLQVP